MQKMTTTVAVIGVGRMGRPMAIRLISAGLAVRLWDRSPTSTSGLVDAGAILASSPAEAVAGADVVLTMLVDGQAVYDAMTGPGGALADADSRFVWLQMSTVGIDWTDRLAELAAEHNVSFVDAPVSGSVVPAATGSLLILASGPDELRDLVAPVLDAMGRRTLWLGPAGAGSRTKLVLNNWLVDLVETTAEALRFGRALGLDPELIVDLLEGAPIGSPYAVDKARHMLAGEFAPNFALKHAVKDADLALAAASSAGSDLQVTRGFIDSWHRSMANGQGERDLSVVYADGDA